MPTVLKCRCGAILLEDREIPTGEDWYRNEVYDFFGGKCPKCGRELPEPSQFVDTMKVDVKPNPATLKRSPLAGAFNHDYHRRNSFVEEAPCRE